MAGLSLNMGMGGSVFAPPGYGSAATPYASGASAQGPTTIGQKAFGIVTGNQGSSTPHIALISAGGLSLALLIFIWWSLPRLGAQTMRITLAGIVVGMVLYWGLQHFAGIGVSGKGKSA